MRNNPAQQQIQRMQQQQQRRRQLQQQQPQFLRQQQQWLQQQRQGAAWIEKQRRDAAALRSMRSYQAGRQPHAARVRLTGVAEHKPGQLAAGEVGAGGRLRGCGCFSLLALVVMIAATMLVLANYGLI